MRRACADSTPTCCSTTGDDDGDLLTVGGVKGYTAAQDGTRQDVKAGAETYGSNGGRFTLNANGAWSFDPDGDFDDLAAGATRTTEVEYTVFDGRADAANTATLTVTVVGRTTNAAPTAGDDAGRTHKGTVLTVAADAEGGLIIADSASTGTAPGMGGGAQRVNAGLLLNDIDPDGDRFSITAVGGTLNTITVVGLGSAVDGIDENGNKGGSFTINADGAWEFDPDGDFDDLKATETRTTSVAYRVADAHGGVATATLTVTVTGSHAPLTQNDFGRTSENTRVSVADGDKGTDRAGGGGAKRRPAAQRQGR